MAEGSGNVANDGMFSIQVLSSALEVFGLQTVPLSSPDAADARADPTTQTAFICNLQASDGGLASYPFWAALHHRLALQALPPASPTACQLARVLASRVFADLAVTTVHPCAVHPGSSR